MKKKILAIQGSSLKRINIKTDTSFFLGLEAQRRNYDIYYYIRTIVHLFPLQLHLFIINYYYNDDNRSI